MSVTFRYGGRDAKPQMLEEANDLLVVRTRRGGPLDATPLGVGTRRTLAALHPVASFEEAGVQVFGSGRGDEQYARRDAAREALKAEPEVAFAGRVLRRAGGQAPVVYTENLFVQLDESMSEAAARSLFEGHGLVAKGVLGIAPGAWFAGARDGIGRDVFALAETLLNVPGVLLCHPEMVTPEGFRAASDQQWHLHEVTIDGVRVAAHAHVAEAWSQTRGEGVTIAVIDDGFDVDHLEFRAPGKVVSPRDVTRQRDDARPQFASDRHGTACAGIACAAGIHGASGVAPAAQLMPIRLRSGVGSVREAEAIKWAVDHGADVISCSWGPGDGDWTQPDDPRHDEVAPLPDHTRLALDYAVSHGRSGKGCVVVWAAGNGNENVDRDHYASADGVMAVGACNDRGTRSPYSDHGDSLWCVFPSDHKLPSLTPGIWTTDRGAGAGYNPGRSPLGDREGHYTNSFGGTSAACPGAAGVAALVLARNPALGWDDVRQLLAATADQIDPDNGEYVDGRSRWYGHGRLNAAAAVAAALPERAGTGSVHHRAVRDVPVGWDAPAELHLEVPDDGEIGDIRVDVNIDHPWRGDLEVMLVPPSALGLAPVLLHNRGGWWRDDVKRVYTSQQRPGLLALAGHRCGGVWTLQVEDHSRRHDGRIVHFGLEIDLV